MARRGMRAPVRVAVRPSRELSRRSRALTRTATALQAALLLAALLALATPAGGVEGSCALYGVCRPPGGDAFTPRSVNCANVPAAVAPVAPAFALTACPEFQAAACCDETQARRCAPCRDATQQTLGSL